MPVEYHETPEDDREDPGARPPALRHALCLAPFFCLYMLFCFEIKKFQDEIAMKIPLAAPAAGLH